MSATAPDSPPAVERPFFVYGTLLPGEPNHDLFLRGRTTGERPAVLPRALLYDGPGYPYAIDGHGRVHGTLLVAAPGVYGELLGLLDHLEEFLGPGHPRNLYERVVREVESAPDPAAGGAGGPTGGTGESVQAWVYLAAAAVTRSLRTGGVLIPEGRWITGRAPGGPDTP
ncbi:gamma-glutamylcyclotransferase family protein [Streptomyces sp. C11-1]|uniref:Gamma-glutamylcyclotransferase family protein n=1 Tax=Streptomyces durocortorensis TaxID=2811104 RepID=A0ABY9VVG8_9ACTN|nr:gamma-glutamylcyclotransferase family protein [Streptomyces durocortorensis]WNF26902.1 gamma-glutamylcyclotransferase family protein [Streptomyces durocortorensis]